MIQHSLQRCMNQSEQLTLNIFQIYLLDFFPSSFAGGRIQNGKDQPARIKRTIAKRENGFFVFLNLYIILCI